MKKIINNEGSVLIEFIIVLPLLLILIIGIIEFGLLTYNKHIIVNASREGARAAIVRGEDYLVDVRIKEIIRDYSNSRLLDFSGNTLADDDITLTAGRTALGFGDDFTVAIEYDYGFLVPWLFHLGTTTTITARTLMKMEQIPGS